MRLGRDEAIRLAKQAETIVAIKGKRVERLAPEDVSDSELAAKLLGPTGNLRAPAMRRGKTLVVGFSPEVYSDLLH